MGSFAPLFTMPLLKTSELEAVNRVLQMLGEAPVNSLSGQFGLAKQAQDSLTDVSRRVQAEGWSFNTDYQVTIKPDSNKNLLVGSNVSRVVVDILAYPDYDIVERKGKLYDRLNQTFEFTDEVKADLTYMYDWDELPEHARQYMMTRAGRQLQEAILGSPDLTKLNFAAEAEARTQFVEEETTKSEHNMIRGNPNRFGPLSTYMPGRAVIR